MKANAIEANAIPPQPDETFFPSVRTKAVLSAVLSGDQTKKTRDRERGGDRPRRTISGGIGHNLPQGAPQAFSEAVIDIAKA